MIVDERGNQMSTGYSREGDPHDHAEESALAKISSDSESTLASATLYSTLEPCSERRSRLRTCTQLIIDVGIPRVVIAWREPALFVADCQGVELLTEHGVEVLEVPELGALASEVGMPHRLP